ncbi:hypothetical protein EKH57_15585 [Halorubrum sp. BOL3-1]|uniref:hypothetical protein n=1 Tax=Halorubrum sp. BOL3-1 TaxID=2497325 RepID=UPI001005039D|nr:hypothetical protein [Halorubrum sp. BOL3-1]QAU14013.1 hypothetical protein EKH57_15585 [Halorubrum sp. BOL3-1]
MSPIQSALPDLVSGLPDPMSTDGLAFYSVWAVFLLAVVRNLRRRAGSRDATQVAVAAGSGSATQGTTRVGKSIPRGDDLSHDEAAFTLPAAIPLSKGVRKVTHNEIHALELGLVVGVVTSWLLSTGRENSAAFLVLAFVAGTLGVRRYGTKAFETVRLEPWYAVVAFAVGGGAGYLFYGTDLLLVLP